MDGFTIKTLLLGCYRIVNAKTLKPSDTLSVMTRTCCDELTTLEFQINKTLAQQILWVCYFSANVFLLLSQFVHAFVFLFLFFLQTFTAFHHSQAWQVKQSPLFVYVVLALAVGRQHLNSTVSSWPFKQCSEWTRLSRANWFYGLSQFKLKMLSWLHMQSTPTHRLAYMLALSLQNKQVK